MIDTSNLTVPASHKQTSRRQRLSLRSKQRDAATRKTLAEGKNLSGGPRHTDDVETMSWNEAIARHLTSEILLKANGVETTPTAKRGVYPKSQDLQNEQSFTPKAKPKAKTRTFKEKATERKAKKLTEHPQAAAAKGARPRQMMQKVDPLEASVPKAYSDRGAKIPSTKKSREDAAKFERQMEEHLIRTGRFVLIV